MKRSSGTRKTASYLSESTNRQLNMCAVAAIVAVVCVLALTPSEAKIVYTHANVVISCGTLRCDQQYKLDLNHDGVTDFTIEVSLNVLGLCHSSSFVSELPASGNGAIGGGFAAALMQGAPIGHSQQFQGSGGGMAFYGTNPFPFCHHLAGGPWYNVSDRYLGLSFQRNGRTHYGWARLTVGRPVSLVSLHAKLTGYAFETIPGKSIKAGQTKEAADDPTNEDLGPGASLTSPIPDKPASLGMLALGAQGVPLWRRKESAVEGD